MANIKTVRKRRKSPSPSPPPATTAAAPADEGTDNSKPPRAKRARRPTEKARASLNPPSTTTGEKKNRRPRRSSRRDSGPLGDDDDADEAFQEEEAADDREGEGKEVKLVKVAAFPTLEVGQTPEIPSHRRHGLEKLVDERFGRKKMEWRAPDGEAYAALALAGVGEVAAEVQFGAVFPPLRRVIVEAMWEELGAVYIDTNLAVCLLLDVTREEMARIVAENCAEWWEDGRFMAALDAKRKGRLEGQVVDVEEPGKVDVLRAMVFLRGRGLPLGLLGEWEGVDVRGAVELETAGNGERSPPEGPNERYDSARWEQSLGFEERKWDPHEGQFTAVNNQASNEMGRPTVTSYGSQNVDTRQPVNGILQSGIRRSETEHLSPAMTAKHFLQQRMMEMAQRDNNNNHTGPPPPHSAPPPPAHASPIQFTQPITAPHPPGGASNRNVPDASEARDALRQIISQRGNNAAHGRPTTGVNRPTTAAAFNEHYSLIFSRGDAQQQEQQRQQEPQTRTQGEPGGDRTHTPTRLNFLGQTPQEEQEMMERQVLPSVTRCLEAVPGTPKRGLRNMTAEEHRVWEVWNRLTIEKLERMYGPGGTHEIWDPRDSRLQHKHKSKPKPKPVAEAAEEEKPERVDYPTWFPIDRPIPFTHWGGNGHTNRSGGGNIDRNSSTATAVPEIPFRQIKVTNPRPPLHPPAGLPSSLRPSFAPGGGSSLDHNHSFRPGIGTATEFAAPMSQQHSPSVLAFMANKYPLPPNSPSLSPPLPYEGLSLRPRLPGAGDAAAMDMEECAEEGDDEMDVDDECVKREGSVGRDEKA
ncbi:hypothetical protein BU24DRAFT_462968 [Aaosphaeria arxii CBS 175.79]|uniref:Uncharacterized protein n=1 Tax=Aaosphaeria arxii CBS 175.79 TaxID=1450172 RepID=A0A6A5XMT2_9PLEO|nr:uncharacterized protein BU24DRAFT_462968 [Aaosphaeria arxii CBS 175.79]KAF2014157.1 hypothetical protein BU24DRAFT_462968 [Aaosphaeria arxii CBS 175.79]